MNSATPTLTHMHNGSACGVIQCTWNGDCTSMMGTLTQVGDCAYVVTDVEAFNAAGGLDEGSEFETCEVSVSAHTRADCKANIWCMWQSHALQSVQ